MLYKEHQSPFKEGGGVDGCVKKTQDFHTGDQGCLSFKVNNIIVTQTTIFI